MEWLELVESRPQQPAWLTHMRSLSAASALPNYGHSLS